MWQCSRTLWGTERGGEEARLAQMSVEAALLLPVALALIALLVQPACVLYTRSVMAATAGELARLSLTLRGGEEELREFALRRLRAVPDLSIFHEGGERGWEIVCTGPDEQGAVSVSIEGRVRPLPLLGSLVAALGTAEGSSVVVRAEATCDMRTSWVGGSYEDWVGIWG